MSSQCLGVLHWYLHLFFLPVIYIPTKQFILSLELNNSFQTILTHLHQCNNILFSTLCFYSLKFTAAQMLIHSHTKRQIGSFYWLALSNFMTLIFILDFYFLFFKIRVFKTWGIHGCKIDFCVRLCKIDILRHDSKCYNVKMWNIFDNESWFSQRPMNSYYYVHLNKCWLISPLSSYL